MRITWIISAPLAMATAPALAGVHAFTQVPEPGSLSLLAMGAAGAALAYRLARKR